MKTSKKILSIVLAVMLLVGTVVVGASAETMVFEQAGSKLVYTATASKAANAEGIIEVEPGETITVSVSAQANYYLGTTGSEIFCWTAGFFNKITVNDVETKNFVNNYTPNKKVIASTAATQLGTGYNKGTHEGFYNSRSYTTDCTAPYDASEGVVGYVFTFTVPETATPGATGEFRMPETCSATVATTSRMRQIYASVNNSDTAYGSSSLGSLYPETIDLTGTILNFKVASAEAPEVPCDYTALEAALNLEPDYDEQFYDEDTWAAYMEALEAADNIDRDMMVDAEGKNQAMIDAAAQALTDAFNALKVKELVDLSALEAALALTPEYAEDYYVADTWDAWQTAVAEGRDTYEGLEGEFDEDWAREEAAAAAQAITDAFAALELKAADYSDVDAAIEEAAQVDRSKYTAASLKKLDDAIAAVVTGLNITHQSEVRDMAKAIRDAIAALAPLGTCNYANLDAAIAEALATDTANCTSASVNAFNDALAAAQAIERDLIADESNVNQSKINAAANALYEAIDGLKKLGNCDYSELDAAIAAYEAKLGEKDLYANWADYKAAYDAAKAVARGMVNDEAGVNQAIIDDAAAALNAVVLKYKDADYSAVDAAKAAATAVNASMYTSASVKAVNDAVAAVVTGYDITKQLEVDAMAKAINDAIAALVPLGECDYAALDAAIIAAQTYVSNKSNYTPASWEASGIDSAYSKAFFIATGDKLIADEAGVNQAKIDAAAKALTDAFNALVPVADKTALAAAIGRATALNEDDYTPESWEAADLENALIAANRVYADADTPQTIVDGMVSAIERAEAKLVKKADKKALADVLDAAKDLNEEDYTPESWEAADLETVIKDTQAVLDDPNASVEDVEVAIDVLEAAAEKLVKKANKDALLAAINTLPEVAEDEAVSATWAAYEAELAEAQAVYADNSATQDEVDAAEANLLAAIAGVKALGTCDYTALDAAIALVPVEDAAAYTEETWKAYAAAKAEAEAIERDMINDEAGANQAKIDAAAKALTDAYNGLELADKSIVLKATPKVNNFNVGDTVEFEFLCAKTNVSKIQIIREGSTTSTYTRTHSKVTSIVDNGDGTETWTIQLYISSDSFNLTAKGKLGKTWETGGYKFKVSTAKAEDIEVKSATATPVAGDAIIAGKEYKIVIVAGADTLRIRLVTPGGSTSTYARTSAVQLDDGTWQWTITRKSNAGDYVYNIYTAGANNKLVDEGTDLVYSVVTAESLVGPSTGNKADIVVSAEIAKARLLVGDVQTVTIVTDKKALGVRLVDENGTAIVKNKDLATATDNGDGTLTWSVTLTAGRAGTVTYDVQALYGNQWQSNGTEISYRIVY